ncbi:hypothetical protein QAD02_023006 [Eretmocerus hayati]|uniref:Uncharacterized protein n=1 Tax=Eretmocerus hayati TaxID=131215 RepID=A0ACC2PUY9_9HYME|nr:hypothetical protein QAD02_023006 [Eretmocerus hayati]
MEGWTRLSDSSWQKFESIFEVNLKTPPLACSVPRTPNAPKKSSKQSRRGADRLQPRRLVFDSEHHQARPGARRQDRGRDRPIRVWEDSGVAIWSSSAIPSQRSVERKLRSTPRSESGNNKRHNKVKGSSRVKAVVNDKRDCSISKKEDDPIKSNFRALRI